MTGKGRRSKRAGDRRGRRGWRRHDDGRGLRCGRCARCVGAHRGGGRRARRGGRGVRMRAIHHRRVLRVAMGHRRARREPATKGARRRAHRRGWQLHHAERLELEQRSDDLLAPQPDRLGQLPHRRLAIHEREDEPIDGRERHRSEAIFLQSTRHLRDEGFGIGHAEVSLRDFPRSDRASRPIRPEARGFGSITRPRGAR